MCAAWERGRNLRAGAPRRPESCVHDEGVWRSVCRTLRDSFLVAATFTDCGPQRHRDTETHWESRSTPGPIGPALALAAPDGRMLRGDALERCRQRSRENARRLGASARLSAVREANVLG